MAGFLTAVRDGIRATQCGLLGFDEFVLGGIGKLSPGLRDVGIDTVNAYRRILGCPPEDDVAPPAPEFEGGQCAGVGYTVNLAGQNFGGGATTAQRSGLGPVQGVCFNDNGFGAFGIGVVFNGFCESSGGGTASTDAPGRDSWVITSIVRDDGQPDDCGSPPPIYPPPAPRPIDIDITYQPDFGPEITVPITVNFSPFEVNFNGDIITPFDFNFGGFNFNGDVSFFPDLDVNINPPRLPPGSGEELDPVGDDEPGDTIEPAPPGEKIIGVVVNAELVNSGLVSEYSSPGIPDIFVPRLGSVKFAYSFGGATFWSSDIDIKDARTFIQCPFSQGADAVVASPQIGVNITFVPIRGYALATVNDTRSRT